MKINVINCQLMIIKILIEYSGFVHYMKIFIINNQQQKTKRKCFSVKQENHNTVNVLH